MNIKIAFCTSKLNLTYKDSIMKSILDEIWKKNMFLKLKNLFLKFDSNQHALYEY